MSYEFPSSSATRLRYRVKAYVDSYHERMNRAGWSMYNGQCWMSHSYRVPTCLGLYSSMRYRSTSLLFPTAESPSRMTCTCVTYIVAVRRCGIDEYVYVGACCDRLHVWVRCIYTYLDIWFIHFLSFIIFPFITSTSFRLFSHETTCV